MIGALIGLIGFVTILGALGMFLMSLNQKLLKRYPATRKQAGWMALTGLVAFIAGVAFTANNPIPPEPARASSATVAQGQVKPTLTAPKATQQQRPSTPAPTAVKPPPKPQASDLSQTVAQYVAGANDQTGDKLRFENGTVDGVTWMPAPRVFQAPEMHVYRVVGQSATAWSLQLFGSKRGLSELVGTSSLRFVGARGLQRVLRVEDGIFKGCIVTVLERTGETRVSTMGYLRVREGEFADWVITQTK